MPPQLNRVFFFPSIFAIVPGLNTDQFAGEPRIDDSGDIAPSWSRDSPAPGRDPGVDGELRLNDPKPAFVGDAFVDGVAGE